MITITGLIFDKSKEDESVTSHDSLERFVDDTMHVLSLPPHIKTTDPNWRQSFLKKYNMDTPENLKILDYPRCFSQHPNVSGFDSFKFIYNGTTIKRRYGRYIVLTDRKSVIPMEVKIENYLKELVTNKWLISASGSLNSRIIQYVVHRQVLELNDDYEQGHDWKILHLLVGCSHKYKEKKGSKVTTEDVKEDDFPSDDSNEPPLISMDKLILSDSSLKLDPQHQQKTTSTDASLLELDSTPDGKSKVEDSKQKKSKDEKSKDEKSKDVESSAGSTPCNKRKRI
jgi:hypothetical protein